MQNFRLAKSIHQFMFVGSVDEHTALNSRHDFTHLSQETLLIISWFVLDLMFHYPKFQHTYISQSKIPFFCLRAYSKNMGQHLKHTFRRAQTPKLLEEGAI